MTCAPSVEPGWALRPALWSAQGLESWCHLTRASSVDTEWALRPILWSALGLEQLARSPLRVWRLRLPCPAAT